MNNDLMSAFSGITVGTLDLTSLISAAISFVVCAVIIKIITILTDKALRRTKKLNGTMHSFIRSAIKVILWVITAIIVADALGVSTTSLVALFSVAGLALSLSVQNIMANLFSGITLLITRPFSTGDVVEIAGKSGTIKSVGLFYTVINSYDNQTISIPNSDVTATSVINFSTEKLRRVDMIFSASYDDETEKVKEAIFTAAKMDERILREPEPFVSINAYKASSIDYAARVWCKSEDYWDVFFAMNENVRRAFAENGVKMSYEHINVHMID